MKAPTPAAGVPALGIAAGAKYVPAARLHLSDWVRKAGPHAQRLLPAMTRNGLAHYHVAPDMDIEALSIAAVQRLLETSGRRAQDIDLVIFCHTVTTGMMAAPASMPALLKKHFAMQRALCHSVSQQSCASVMCALRLLRTLMWRHPALHNVLLVSTDKVYGERYRNVSDYAIQSDGSMALWLSRDWPLNRIGPMSYSVDPCYHKGGEKGPVLGRRFALNYPLLARRMIAEVMERSGWSVQDVDAVLPMNANLSAFSRVMEMLQLPLDKLHSENIGVVGHMFSCDPFLNFLDRFAQPARVHSGNAILFASASTGVFTAVGIDRSWTGPPVEAPMFPSHDRTRPSARRADAPGPEPEPACSDSSPRSPLTVPSGVTS